MSKRQSDEKDTKSKKRALTFKHDEKIFLLHEVKKRKNSLFGMLNLFGMLSARRASNRHFRQRQSFTHLYSGRNRFGSRFDFLIGPIDSISHPDFVQLASVLYKRCCQYGIKIIYSQLFLFCISYLWYKL